MANRATRRTDSPKGPEALATIRWIKGTLSDRWRTTKTMGGSEG